MIRFREPAHVAPLREGETRLAARARVCARVLDEARRLSGLSIYNADFGRLLARADELLDEIDEVLVTLEPGRNPREFALAADLHRALEQIQAAIPPRFRSRAAAR